MPGEELHCLKVSLNIPHGRRKGGVKANTGACCKRDGKTKTIVYVKGQLQLSKFSFAEQLTGRGCRE